MLTRPRATEDYPIKADGHGSFDLSAQTPASARIVLPTKRKIACRRRTVPRSDNLSNLASAIDHSLLVCFVLLERRPVFISYSWDDERHEPSETLRDGSKDTSVVYSRSSS
jgi:hypothetical protein